MMQRLAVIRSDDGRSVHCDHQPGNGTWYRGMAFKIPEAVPHYGGQWLVAFPEFGGSWYFHENDHVHFGYVAEKLGILRYKTSAKKLDPDSPDVHEMTKMIAAMVPGVTFDALTDDSGHFPESHAVRVV